jgi:hypothetical protein
MSGARSRAEQAADRELAALVDGPWAPAWYWRDELEAQQQAGRRMHEQYARRWAVVAACDCGWTGTTRYPTREEFDEDAEELALAEWEHAHARPVLEHHQQAQTTRLRARLRDLADQLTTTGGESGRHLIDRLDRILRALDQATQLAHQLREQAEHQHPTQQKG